MVEHQESQNNMKTISICDVINCETNLIFLIKPLFLRYKKAMTETEISWEGKEILGWFKKYFAAFLISKT